MEENSSFHNNDLNNELDINKLNSKSENNDEHKFMESEDMEIENNNNEFYNSEKSTEKTEHVIPEIDRMDVDNNIIEMDDQNVPDADSVPQQKLNNQSSIHSIHSNHSTHSIHSNHSIHSRPVSHSSSIRGINNGNIQQRKVNSHSNIHSIHNDQHQKSISNTNISKNHSINDIVINNNSKEKKKENNSSFIEPISNSSSVNNNKSSSKSSLNQHSSQFIESTDLPKKISSKNNSKTKLKSTSSTSISKSHLYNTKSEKSLKSNDNIMPKIDTISSSSSYDELNDLKSLLVAGNKISEVSLLSDDMTKEQVSERLLKRLYSVTSKTLPQSHFRFNGKRTISGVRLNPIIQSRDGTRNLDNYMSQQQQHLNPIKKNTSSDNNENKYYLKARKPEISPVKKHKKFIENVDYHSNDLLYLLLNGSRQHKHKNNALKRINNFVQDDHNTLNKQMNHFTPIPPIPSNSNKRIKIIEEDQEDNEATLENNELYSEYNNNNNNNNNFYMQPSELAKKNSPFKFIEYIQQHPETNEFIYCNIIKPKIAKGQPSYNPYNLEVVEYSNIDRSSHFYTLSAKGATMFDKNNHAEFTPLDQWLREYDLFHKLLKIPFFARYRLWKVFKQWKSYIFHVKIEQAKKKLSHKLFIVHPILRDALLEVRKEAVEISGKKLLVEIKEKNIELSFFINKQKEWLQKIQADVLKTWENKIRVIVEDASKKCLEEQGFEVDMDDYKDDDDDDDDSDENKEDKTNNEKNENEKSNENNKNKEFIKDQSKREDDDNEEKVKSESKEDTDNDSESQDEKKVQKEKKQMTFTEQAARRTECRRLKRFVKLVDYITINTLHVLILDSTRSLLGYIFNGCTDDDVSFQNKSQKNDDEDDDMYIDNNVSESNTLLKYNSSSQQLDESDQMSNNIQIGGVIVGKEVKTSDLIKCGFQNFFNIMTELKRQSINIYMDLIEEYDDPISLKIYLEEQKKLEMKEKTVEKQKEENDAVVKPEQENANEDEKKKQNNIEKKLVENKPEILSIFHIELLLNTVAPDRNLYFNPPLMDFINSYDNIIKLFISLIESFQLLSNTIPYLEDSYVFDENDGEDADSIEGSSVVSIILDDNYFRELVGRIRGVFVGVFDNAFNWMKQWEGVRNMWVENESFKEIDVQKLLEVYKPPDFMNDDEKQNEIAEGEEGEGEKEGKGEEDMEVEEEEKEGEGDEGDKQGNVDVDDVPDDEKEIPKSKFVDYFEDALKKYSHQLEEMEAIPILTEINNVCIDTTNLKKELIPSPQRCFSEVSRILPNISKDKNEGLLTQLQDWIRTLNDQPKSVEQFVEYLGSLDYIKRSMRSVEYRFNEVTRLFNLMEEYNISSNLSTDFALFQTLAPTVQQLNEVIEMAIDTKEDNISKFSTELEKNYSELLNEVLEIRNKVQEPLILNQSSKCENILQLLDALSDGIQKLEDKKCKFEEWEKLFIAENPNLEKQQQPKTENKELDEKKEILMETKTEVELKRTLWKSIENWKKQSKEWKTCQFDTLDTEDMNTQIQALLKTIYTLDKGLPPNDVVPYLRDMVKEIWSIYPTIVDLRNPALKQRHWDKIQEVIGKIINKEEEFNLGKLIEENIFDFREEISNISSQASSEMALEEMLNKLIKLWNDTEFQIQPYRDYKDVFLLIGIEEIQTQLEDSQVTIATIKGSRHIGPIKNEVEKWDKQLTLFADTLDAWLNCQRNWRYLESIFSAPDIQRQLPDESKMFSQVDRSWKEVMRKVARNPNAMKAGTAPGLLETMEQNNILLDKIQKCLEDYLESKRLLFPRFYFLSNEELLEILSQTRNPQAVQPHLGKCFDSIKSLEFGSEPKSIDIFAMNSPEGERVSFGKTLKARGNVESWLGSVEEGMVSVLKKLIKAALNEYDEQDKNEWIMNHCGMVVLTVSQIIWCRDVTECIESGNPGEELNRMYESSVQNLNNLASVVRGDLTKLQRSIFSALITTDVHARDIVQNLIDEKCSSSSDFVWSKQLRYYWDVNADTCIIKMSTSVFNYGYEYLGCSPRLVITPLTDRCYLTLTGAINLNLGGSPVGPAGTGKTETVKDLSKALARQCVVFNCSDGLDYKMMGKMFAGLAQSGAWCCFDEFNRIDIEVLSVIAQQLLSITHAKMAHLTKFMFEGREIRLIDTCCSFITMNPGYAGRTELPDNLKALFRPIAMMIPDYGLIAEIILYSEGFENAKSLSGKVVNLYKLCSEQLSQQDHYDFGMRAVKSVLVMAGTLKRANPDLTEDVVLIRSLRDSNIPKFIAEDIPLFRGILQDLFPGIIIPDVDFGEIMSMVKEVMEEEKLKCTDTVLERIIQLYDTMNVRHGVMLVGPTGGGKTTAYEVLAKAKTKLKEKAEAENWPKASELEKVKMWVLNPKCVTMAELYGEFNLNTMEWRDGLVGYFIREQVADTSKDEKWTVFDGPVDALWIENMNSVLDDNKLLCLNNGERIRLNNTQHLVFEVADLAVASPATVSRCGMVYIDSDVLGWRPYTQTWLSKLPENITDDLKAYIYNLFENYIDSGLRFVRRNCKEYIPSTDFNLVTSLCKLYHSFIVHQEVNFKLNKKDIKSILAYLFLFCYIWSLGGNLADGYQDAFDTFLKDMLENVPINEIHIPNTENLFSYYIDFKKKSFVPWENMVPTFEYNSEIPYFQMIVPTPDTVKYTYLLKMLLNANYPVLFTGKTGVGKSVTIQDLISKTCREHSYIQININFSAQTTSSMTQEMIEIKLEKKRKNIFGAPGNSKIILFVDDLNMPKLDTYGSQPPIELLRQYIGSGGFYDREKLSWKIVQDVSVVAACAPPGGGRNNITPRLIRYFNLLSLPNQSELSLNKIFKSILEGFLKPFSDEINSVCDAIIHSTIEIYERMCKELLPTPTKSHYTFNLRDLSKVIQGILQVTHKSIETKLDIVKLFCHESARVFQDRLIDDTDRIYFNNLLSELVDKNFNIQFTPESLMQQPIFFGDFMKPGVPVDERVYVEINDLNALNSVLEDYLEEYNVMLSKNMRLIFFLDAKQHISRIARILRQPRGNAMLVGIGGTGKQSLTRLACHISDYKCHQIELTRTYGMDEWREDIKKLYRLAGVENKNTVFLITDTQIKCETFLEDINNILNTGEIPNLFEFEEREKIIGDLRPVARDNGLNEDRDSVLQFFTNRVRDNLHIVFGTSPVGDSFRNRCRMFPSLVNCCTIDWFDEWPKDALLSVSKKFLEYTDLGSDEMKEKISEMCVEIHASVSEMSKLFYEELRRHYYTTPVSYLELINLYIVMLQEKRKELSAQRDRLKNGLDKLNETNEMVANMQVELEQLQPVLVSKTADVESLMVQISKDQEVADGVRKVVSEEEAVVREKASQTQAIADEAQKDLDEALPALEAAYKALDALDKKDIAELKVFTKPPDLVLSVMEAICILFKVKPDWDSSKKLLGDPQIMKKMIEFDKDNIPETTTKKLKKYIENPSFTPENVEKVSKACKSMCMWVIALDKYSHIFREVQPKRKRLEEAQDALKITQAKLAEKTAALKQVEDQLNDLKQSFENSNAEKQELINKKEETTRRLERASKLTLALADEQERWIQSVDSLNNQIEALNGNVFLAAACVAYYGAFTSTYRQKLVKRWIDRCQELDIPILESFNLIDTLSDQVMVREWNMQGLPSDTLSTENGILVTRGRRWPLMIDPQGQANRWIRSREGSDLQVIKLSEPKFLRSLENAIRTGLPVLLEDVGETLDSALEPLLLKQTVRQGGRTLMKLGDSYVEYDKNFKLYITTKLPNPHYLPEICIKVTIINFTVTREGLEGQLLADVVKIERAELEEQRNELIVNISNDKKQLRDIEEKILRLLFNSEGNILDDEELINTLNKSKITSAAIQQRVQQSEVTEQEINAAREKYLPVSIRGAIIYFVVANLAEIDPMYQFSLKYFKNLFNLCIKGMTRDPNLDVHITNMCKKITYTIFSNVSRGLFERHKLIFSFMICVEILKEDKLITDDEWNFFLRGAISQAAPAPKPAVNWLSESVWHEVLNLSESLPDLQFVESTLQKYPTEWNDFMISEEPFESILPDEKEKELSDIQKLIIVKVLREELVVSSIISFIKKNIGKEFIDSIPLDISLIYKDTSYQTPLIFILSTGSDPTQILVKFSQSKEIKYENRLHIISLGQGQGPIAENLVRKAQTTGDWVFLQNCHLAKSWMNRLESIVKELSENPDGINPDFRLYLSSMPSNIFPIAVLQEGVKVTNEPPKGLKANLARSFADIDQDTYEGCVQNASKYKKLLFGICFFNAVIHERKKFGPLGWNILYDWSTADLEVSITILKNMMNDYKLIQWDALLYLTGEITFGGRVTDDWDRRALKCILRKYYCHEILEDKYLLSPNGVYYVPVENDLEQIKKYVDSLPYTEDPSVFGMHENANISYQIQETKRVIKTIVDIQPRLVTSGSGKSNEDIVTDLANAMLSDWPSPLVIEMPSEEKQESSIEDENGEIVSQSTSSLKFMNSGVTEMMKFLFQKDENGRILNSLSTVLSQECVRFNKLLNTVKVSLENLIKAIKGFVVMSQELESVFDSLLNNEVPHAWSTVAYLSLKPLGGWVTDLHRRITFMADWIENGQPKTFWLPGFFFPQGFLTGTLQNHARKYNIPIDTLKFAYEIVPTNDDGTLVEDPNSTNEDGVLVEGLFIEGAHYDKETKLLQDSYPMEMNSLMPIIRFLPTEHDQNEPNQYVCPLYKTSDRAGTLSTTGHSTNFIVAVNLPSDKSPDFWISRGVALLCQPD